MKNMKWLLLTASLVFSAQAFAVDSDGDGVDDSVDAFPSDKCASVDTDLDEYPDSFHTGGGCFYEDFSSGGFIQNPWQITAGSGSGVTNSGGRAKLQILQSTPLLSITLTFTQSTLFKFDYLATWQLASYGPVLYIDGVLDDHMVYGNSSWQSASIPVSAGSHTFAWRGQGTGCGSSCGIFGTSYTFYLDNLVANNSTLTIDNDDDNDGAADTTDRFPLDPSEAFDRDNDGIGDNADPDDDNDGLLDISDNCPLVVNVDQLNTDGDAYGNVCDTDDDNDGVADTTDKFPLNPAASSDSDNDGFPGSWNGSCDATCQANSGLTLDNCPTTSNPTQANNDGDAQGDACDTDDDNDGVLDTGDAYPLDPAQAGDIDGDGVDGFFDNCPSNGNANQLNTDGDAQGNVCDSDDDNDSVNDASDKFPLNPAASSDTDNDGYPGSWNGACDATCQAASGLTLDNCPTTSNPTQANNDGDSQGDACDADDDNDTVADGADNCPLVSNLDQLNTDGDAQGNTCDTDDDNDGVTDTADRYPLDATRYQNPRHSTDIDRDSDILVRSASVGSWTRYSVQNNAIVGNGSINAPTSADSVYVAQLDANGDGDADILTRSASTGAWTLSIVENGAVTSSVPLYLYANLGYVFVGTGDFNNDGVDDVMLRHATNGYRVFLLANHAVSTSVYYNAWTGASSVDQGIGDFNGDGTDDLLVRRTSDNLYFIFKTIDGAVNNYYCACNIWANTDWTFQFAGDTNKDGIDDIVIRGTGESADGKWWAFRMSNFKSSLYTNLNLFINKTAITVGAVGDYNADGTIDVLTRVNNSTTYVSPITNGTVGGNYLLYNFTTDQVIGK